jgi:hypothetical protein
MMAERPAPLADSDKQPDGGWAWIIYLLAVVAVAIGAVSSLAVIVEWWTWGLKWPLSFIENIRLAVIGWWWDEHTFEQMLRSLRYTSGFLFLTAGVACLRERPWSRSLFLVASVLLILDAMMSLLLHMYVDSRWGAEMQIGQATQLSYQAALVFFMVAYIAFPVIVLAVMTRPRVKDHFARPSSRRGFEVLPRS